MPPTVRHITAATATRLRALGFSGVTVIVPKPLEARRHECERAGAILSDGGITIAQVNPRYEMLVQPDNDLRAHGCWLSWRPTTPSMCGARCLPANMADHAHRKVTKWQR